MRDTGTAAALQAWFEADPSERQCVDRQLWLA